MLFEIFDNLTEMNKKIPAKKMVQAQAGKTKIALLKNQNEKWIAFKDACPHLQIPLTKGELTDDNCVLCTFHRYKFSLENGEEVNGKNTSPLRFFALFEKQNKLFVEIADEDLIEKDEFSF